MKIQAINNNIFKGLYTDKSAQNNNNWKVEYQPYSWEVTGMGEYEFGSGVQTDVDILATELPDNEKIYVPSKYANQYYNKPEHGRESCHDILGTEFYYHDFDTNTMQNKIDYKEALNREDSLKVYNQKLGKFLEMKEKALTDLEEIFSMQKKRIIYDCNSFDEYAEDYDKNIFDCERSERHNKCYMVGYKNKIEDETKHLFDNIEKYTKIRKSMNSVKKLILDNENQINILKRARERGNLIDISQRIFVDNPNKPLLDALQNINKAKDKIVALPNQTVFLQDILKTLNIKYYSKFAAMKVINVVDELVKTAKYKKI